MNQTPLSYIFYAFNWIPSMAMLMTAMAIAEMAKIAILAIMATIVMADVNFSMAIGGTKLQYIRNNTFLRLKWVAKQIIWLLEAFYFFVYKKLARS